MIDWKAAGYTCKVLFTAKIKLGKETFELEETAHFGTVESAMRFISAVATKRMKQKKYSNFRIVTL